MLDDWAIGHSGLKKRVATALYEGRHLRNAACLHALSDSEAEAMRRRGLTNPICVIPNGVDVPAPQLSVVPPWRDRVPDGQRVLLFLGRLHAKKGIAELLKAWNEVRRDVAEAQSWSLAIAGWTDGRDDFRKHPLAGDSSVVWLGPAFDEQKNACFAAADAFILPSRSEGLPMAVLEAWAHALPCLLTPACNLPEGRQAGASIEMAPEVPSIAEAIGRLMRLSEEQRRAMGRAGRELAQHSFGWPSIGARMFAIYRWLLRGGEPPTDVRL